MSRLHEKCQASGLTSQDFSYGFVRLLTRRLLEPRGDLTFGLSADGYTLGDAACLLKGVRGERHEDCSVAGGDEGKSGI